MMRHLTLKEAAGSAVAVVDYGMIVNRPVPAGR